MTIFQAVVLGIIQGLAEFLPISSSAHLIIAPWLFHWPEPDLSFDVALHVGTLVAVLVYFRAEWVRLLAAFGRVLRARRMETAEERRVGLLIVATIPGAVAGVLLDKYAESTFRAPVVIGIALIVLGIVLWVVDRYAPQRLVIDQMGWGRALIIGASQALAIIPGVSRSGSTITAGRAVDLSRDDAAVFSFLMSMPIIAGAAIIKVPHALHEAGMQRPLLAGVLAAALSGLLAIWVLLRFVRRHSYGAFALYRVLAGALILWIAFSRA